MAAECDAE